MQKYSPRCFFNLDAALRLLKPFAFYLLSFTCFMLSCHRNPDMQTPGITFIQGEWQQDSIEGQKQLLSYSTYHLKFSCDSFFMSINSVSKVNTGSDSCMNVGHWMEYTKGTYEQRHDTLHFKGQFTNADRTLKDDKGCFRSGDYEDYFKLNKKTDSLLQFLSTSNVIPINVRLVKRTTCTLKPL